MLVFCFKYVIDKNEINALQQRELYGIKINSLNYESAIVETIEKQKVYKKLKEKYEYENSIIAIFFLSLFIMVVALYIYNIKQWNKTKTLNQQQLNFFLSTAHEFKSPLTAIKLIFETLQHKNIKPEQSEMLINNGLHESQRLDNLIQNILLISKIENKYPFDFANENISDIITRILQNFKKNNAPNRQFIATISSDIYYDINITAFESIILNLLENADKYSEKNKPIYVNLVQKEQYFLLEVIDEGQGIQPGDRDKIFEKFYRSSHAKSLSAKGIGVGLYLTKKFIEIHQASISISKNHPQGTIFTARFPISKQ